MGEEAEALNPQGLGEEEGVLHQRVHGEEPGVLGKLQAPPRAPLVKVDHAEALQVVLEAFPQDVGVPPGTAVEDEEGGPLHGTHVLHVKLRLPYGDVPDLFPHPL